MSVDTRPSSESCYRKFKGTDTEYRMLHYWVENQLGKPMECWSCKTTGIKRYHWANKSGEYRQDVSDWERLCPSCHAKKDWLTRSDAKKFCIRGHKLDGENIYVNPQGKRKCRTCKTRHMREWREHNRERANEHNRKWRARIKSNKDKSL